MVPVMVAFYNTDRKTVKERSIYRSRVCINSKEYENVMSFRRHIIGPHGFLGSGENGYLFSGSWEALVIIFRDLGSKLIVLGIYGALQKIKKYNSNNLTLKEKPSFCLIFFKKSSASGGKPPRPPLGNLSVFTFVLT